MAIVKIKRGQQEAVERLSLAEGELAVALDTGNLYVGATSGNIHVNPKGGTADQASKLSTPHNFSITGDGTAEAVKFDGTQDVTLNFVLSNIAELSAGSYTKVTVNEKGQVTAGQEKITIEDISDLTIGTEEGNVVAVGAGNKIAASLIPDLSTTYVNVSQLGVANGVATLGEDSKIPAAQLPSYVDDVVEAYTRTAGTPLSADWLSLTNEPVGQGTALTPSAGIIYVVLTEGEYVNKTYRWSGSTYVEISQSLALGDSASNAYPGDKGKIAYDHAMITDANPHNTTAEQVGAAPASHINTVASDSVSGHIKVDGTELTVQDGVLKILIVDGGTFE